MALYWLVLSSFQYYIFTVLKVWVTFKLCANTILFMKTEVIVASVNDKQFLKGEQDFKAV